MTQGIRESQRSAFLADLGPLLAASLDYEVTLARIARSMTRAFSATVAACVLHRHRHPGALRRVAVAHRDPEREHLVEASPLNRVRRAGSRRLLFDGGRRSGP